MMSRSTTLALSCLALLACGDDSGPGQADAASASADAAAGVDARQPDGGSFALQSSAYLEGAVIPTKHTCQGANLSPALSWANAPEGTLSFAIVFTDVSTDFLHSAIWDIPATRLQLPEDVDSAYEPADVPGAKQPEGYSGTRGYAGPCPGSEHSYEFRLHALGAETLGGVGEASTRFEVVSAIEAASLGSVTLTGSFDPNNP